MLRDPRDSDSSSVGPRMALIDNVSFLSNTTSGCKRQMFLTKLSMTEPRSLRGWPQSLIVI